MTGFSNRAAGAQTIIAPAPRIMRLARPAQRGRYMADFNPAWHLILGMSLAASTTALAADLTLRNLSTTYAIDPEKCARVLGLLENQDICRPLGGCNNPDEWELRIGAAKQRMFSEIATNQYGYTQVFRTTTSLPDEFEVLYVQRFQGDRHARLMETYQVSKPKLAEVLALPPGPLPYETWIKLNTRPSRETSSNEFEALLKAGHRLSEEWSPVVNVDGEYCVYERECAGSWEYGGYYSCARIIKLTAKKLFSHRPALPYCQMTRSE